MHQSFEKNLITTKDAGELSGYSSDYLSRLVRSRKILGEKVGHSWLIDKASLERFLSVHGNNKIERARELADARAREYRAHRSLLHRATKNLTASVSASKRIPARAARPDLALSSFASHASAFATALIVVASGAVAAQAAIIPQFADRAMSLVNETAVGFDAAFGDIPARVASRIAAANDAMQASVAKVAETNQVASAKVASLVLAEPNLSPLRMKLDDSQQTSRVASPPKTALFISDAPVLTLADVHTLARNVISTFTSPSNLMRAYVSMGEHAHAGIGSVFTAYDALIRTSGVQTLTLAAQSRDMLATLPNFVSRTNLAFGESVIAATHAAIRADVAVAYWTAAAAPAASRATVARIGSAGDTLARATSRVPAVATTAYLRAVSAPAVLAPAIARSIFDVEYAGAVRFVAVANNVSGNYLALIKDTGNVAYETAARVRGVRDMYLGALGSSALAIDTAKKISLTAAAVAAIAQPLSLGEQAALATYEAIHGIFSSANDALAAFFTTTPEIILPTGVPKSRVVTVATSTKPATPYLTPTVSSPTYTTIVQGVSTNLLSQSLASLRTEMFTAIANQIRPVAAQTATNIQTIQMINKIEKLNDLTVTNGTFTGGIFDSGIRVSATSGTFDHLGGGTTTLANTTINGNLTVSGTATSTFAGNLSVSGNINLNGALLQNNAPFIGSQWTTSGSNVYYSSGSVGVGTTTPWAQLSVNPNGISGPSFAIGSSTATDFVVTNGGNVGIGTSSPAYKLDVNGIVNATALYVSGSPYIGSQWTTSGSNITYSTGNVGIGTTTPFANFSLAGTAGSTTNLFAVSTSTAGFATTTALTVDSNGNLSLLGGANLSISGALTQTGLAAFTGGFLSHASSTITSGLFTMNGGASTTQLTTTGSTYLATTGGNVGIGTTTPYGLFSLSNSVATTANTPLFVVASTTSGTSTSTLMTILASGRVGIGTPAPDASAVLDIASIVGGLLVPRLTTAQKAAVASPAAGLTLYDVTLNKLNVYNGSVWKNVGSTEIGGEVTSGTQGSVLFIGDGSVLGQSANFNFSTSTGFFGLGTSTPFANLSLAGSAGGTTNLLAVSTSTAGFATTTALTVDSNGNLALLNGANLSVAGNTTNTGLLTQTGLATFTGGFLSNASSTITAGLFSMSGGASTTQLTTTGSTYLATTGGNVGIGTTTPYSLLSISNSASTAANTPLFTIASTTAGTATSTLMIILANGNVGIGTTSPVSKLSVVGESAFAGGASFGLGYAGTAAPTNGLLVQGSIGIGTTSPMLALSVQNTSASGQFVAAYDSSNYSTMVVDATGDLKITAKGGDIRALNENLWICDNGGCPTLTATSTAGNVFVENAVTFGNGFSMASTSNAAASELGLYNASGQLMVIFDDLP